MTTCSNGTVHLLTVETSGLELPTVTAHRTRAGALRDLAGILAEQDGDAILALARSAGLSVQLQEVTVRS